MPYQALLLLVLITEVAGLSSLRERECWLSDHWSELRECLQLSENHASPSDSTICRVLNHVDVSLLQEKISECLRFVLCYFLGENQIVHLALDGKCRAGVVSEATGRTETDLTLFNPQSALVVGKTTLPDKKGESTVAPDFLFGVFNNGLHKSVITFDCALTTPRVTESVIENGCEYLGSLKKCNGRVYEIAQSFEWGDVEVGHWTEDSGRGRDESRMLKIIEISQLPESDRDEFLKYKDAGYLLRVQRTRKKTSEKESTYEEAYYLGSCGLSFLTAGEFLRIQREHWGIENRSNWNRDVLLREDKCRTKSKNASRALGAFRDIALHSAYAMGGTPSQTIFHFRNKPAAALAEFCSLNILQTVGEIGKYRT